jgi:hypothetical protein
MALIHRPGETIPFSPADQDAVPAAKRITYYLRVPSVYDRVALRRALAERQARLHSPIELLNALRRGVEEIMADHPAARRDFLLAAIDEQIVRQSGFIEAMGSKAFDLETDAGRDGFAAALTEIGKGGEALREIEGHVARGYPPYAALLGDNEVFWVCAGVEGARLLLEDCDGLPGFRRTRMGVDETFLASMPEHHFVAIAMRVQQLLSPSEDDAKNSGSPSGSSSEAAISKASKTRPRKTRSKTTPGT